MVVKLRPFEEAESLVTPIPLIVRGLLKDGLKLQLDGGLRTRFVVYK